MTITQQQQDDVLIITPGKKVTVSDHGQELSEAVQQALAAGVRKVVFDFAKVEFIDSVGVGQIVASFVSVKNHEGRLVLTNLGSRVALVLQMAGLNLILNIQNVPPQDVAWE